MLMDPPAMQSDCQLENGVEKIPSIAYDSKHTLSHDNYAWQGPDVHLTNDAHNPVEVNNSSQTGTDEKLDGSSEKYSVSLDGLPQVKNFAPYKEKNGEDAYFSNVRFQLNASTENNGSPSKDTNCNKHCISKEDLHHSQEDMHALACRVTGLRSCQSNGDALPSEDQKMIEEQIKQNANVDAESKEVVTDMMGKQVGTEMLSKEVRTDMVGSHAVHKELHCTVQDLSERANDIALVRKKIQEENETSITPKNGTDLLVHNNSCNGNTNDAGGEMGAGEDHAVALWVKWRGKWQTGIRCCRVDCPLSTLKAKPTIDRKSYIVVFFPRTRTYSWVDMLLILPIDEYPVPLVNGTHRKWRTLVKDLSVPRRFIMQKLAISMLNFSDELHTEAIIENARKAAAWKEFAQEASCCKDYTDLGKMLVKLQNMILPDYTSSHWLQNSSNLWVQKCNTAHDAETVEILAEELRQSVLWDKVDELWNASMQPELAPEWKTWKQEVMKQFFSSYAIGNTGNFEQSNCYDDPGMDQHTRRKRPKLEVRRGETHFSHMDDANCSTLSEDPNHNNLSSRPIVDGNIEASASTDQNNTVTFLSNSEPREVAESISINPDLQNGRHEFAFSKNSRQCSAFMETKGRQCGRWANDGDIYCCVHQSMHFAEHSSREDKALTSDTVVCSGMTNRGRQCKHRAQHGSVFCKKHHPQTNLDTISSDHLFSSAEGLHKREESPNKLMERNCNSNAICHAGSERASGSQVSVQVKLIPTMTEEISGDKARGLESTDLLYPMSTSMATANLDTHLCIGILSHDNIVECQDYAKRHTLYCEKHLPKFLKRARDGKSRLISKDVFINLLKCCASKKEKICLHRACEFLYWFLRNNISRQHSGLDSDYMPQLLAEVSKDPGVGEFLLKLISSEREKLTNLWGFGANESKQLLLDNPGGPMMVLQEERTNPSAGLKCKICFQDFSDDQSLGLHWTEVHRKETRWLFRGYSCAVCMDPFTNRKVLEKHVQGRHGAQFIQYSILFRCMSCNTNLLNMDLLWQHIVSDHTHEFRLLDAPQRPKNQSVKRTEGTSIKALYDNHNLGKDDGSQKLTCRLCGLKFDILPDLRRHHQVAHMDQASVGQMPSGSGKYQLNRGRHYYSAFRKSLRPSTLLKKSGGSGIERHFKISSSDLSMITSQFVESETANLGKLLDFQCSDLAQTLFSKIQKTRPHPSNLDILSVARSVCCKTGLLAALEVKYGIMPKNIFVKAAKLCSDIGIQINWHQEEFICPKGCKSGYSSNTMSPLQPTQVDIPVVPSVTNPPDNGTWVMEEYHYVLDSEDFKWKLKNERVVLCEDVSFGGEKFPIVCAIDVDAKESVRMKPEELVQHCSSVPWQGFHYVTARLMDSSLVDSENCVVSCACSQDHCSPGKCDHVNLFDGVHENPVDIYGLPMHGRFAYDENSKIVLQEGYPIYECNSLCTCDASCPNKVLQQGLLVNLEIFRTENKGWAIRAAESIPRGTFVCEYVGEVVKDDHAMRNVESEAKSGCSYLLNIASHIDRERIKTLGTSPYMIDATRYGNVSRFINHSCSPNLNTRLVLVESKDCQLAHIGLFANQDIAPGEELSYDYRQKLLPGDGCPCCCGAQNCRGRVY